MHRSKRRYHADTQIKLDWSFMLLQPSAYAYCFIRRWESAAAGDLTLSAPIRTSLHQTLRAGQACTACRRSLFQETRCHVLCRGFSIQSPRAERNQSQPRESASSGSWTLILTGPRGGHRRRAKSATFSDLVCISLLLIPARESELTGCVPLAQSPPTSPARPCPPEEYVQIPERTTERRD